MKVGVFTALYGAEPLEGVLDRLAALGVEAVELGTGNYPGSAHCDPDELLADPERARALRGALERRGLAISALSQHGNPLHPNESIARHAHRTWRRTLEVAELLEVPTVIAFSGCPGDGAGSARPNWVTCAWPDEYLDLLEWQWNNRVIPYWRREVEIAGAHGVRVAIEPHPGFVVYSPLTLIRLRDATGPLLGVNYDPSHLFWQGIDPVISINDLGHAGAIFHVHAKDTYLDAALVRRRGVLETAPLEQFEQRSWSFRTVGDGHDEAKWDSIVRALQAVGYDGTISLEHEDPLLGRDEGVAKGVAFLHGVIAATSR